MTAPALTDRDRHHTGSRDRAPDHRRRRSLPPIELWRMRDPSTEAEASRGPRTVRGLAVETCFGYAFALEADGERIEQRLDAGVDALLARADRVEASLLAQGYRPVAARRSRPPRTPRRHHASPAGHGVR